MSGSALILPVLALVTGILIGHLIPRLPAIFMSRFSFFNAQLPPHPAPVSVDGDLLARVLLMRNLRVLGLMLALMPMALGLMAVIGAHSPFGVGLILGSAWTILSWLLPEDWTSHKRWPCNLSIAERLQMLRNDSADEEKRCCNAPEIHWEVANVRCAACLSVLLEIPRPDLGRKRSDGWLLGSFRVWLLDGRSPLYFHPVALDSGEEE